MQKKSTTFSKSDILLNAKKIFLTNYRNHFPKSRFKNWTLDFDGFLSDDPAYKTLNNTYNLVSKNHHSLKFNALEFSLSSEKYRITGETSTLNQYQFALFEYVVIPEIIVFHLLKPKYNSQKQTFTVINKDIIDYFKDDVMPRVKDTFYASDLMTYILLRETAKKLSIDQINQINEDIVEYFELKHTKKYNRLMKNLINNSYQYFIITATSESHLKLRFPFREIAERTSGFSQFSKLIDVHSSYYDPIWSIFLYKSISNTNWSLTELFEKFSTLYVKTAQFLKETKYMTSTIDSFTYYKNNKRLSYDALKYVDERFRESPIIVPPTYKNKLASLNSTVDHLDFTNFYINHNTTNNTFPLEWFLASETVRLYNSITIL
ncbi:hypothetical protein [Ligilactobacillus animalis]|uniref:hypothetical protein n=1 Tax=Ligilactobacillus animalis TaxID=1605 RepID=UPI0026DF4754|nr:hypothetical protein [Ligilactobacillus animalis]MDO5883017.1 hypothetical protein [Ligilactobacillus animalis]